MTRLNSCGIIEEKRLKAMSVIIVGLVLLSRVFLMMLKVFWIVLCPILLIACIVFVCINFMQRKR